MFGLGAPSLVLGGAMSAIAAAAHLACIPLGARAYRFLGAGEGMARAAQAGKKRPMLITLAIAAVLFVWALYAFSGAGWIERLPGTRAALPAIGLIYLARAVATPLLRPRFPRNSTAFWAISSGICLVIGLFYAVGTIDAWPRL